MEFLHPKTIELAGKQYVISKFPAITGREIVAKYPMSALPKIGDYAVNQEMCYKILSYVAVITENGTQLPLTTRTLIENHCTFYRDPDGVEYEGWEVTARLEKEMMEYNCSFFRDGRISAILGDTGLKVSQWITKTLTGLSVPSLPKEEPPTKS